jgi:RNA polymerase sigma-70 factor (ECF subfamily)
MPRTFATPIELRTSRPKPPTLFANLDDAALVDALRKGHAAARAELFDRHAERVQRILLRILGNDRDLSDLLHDVFVRALTNIDALADSAALRSWLMGIAVMTAREALTRRARSRWLRFLPFEQVPDVACAPQDDEACEAVRATYSVLDTLGEDDRITFALRFIEGLELTEVAAALGVSLNTCKRRVADAQRRFLARARREPSLRELVEAREPWRRT